MIRRTRVYLSGPIGGSGRLTLNVRRAIQVADELLSLGYAPYVPHLTSFWELVQGERPHEQWLALDKEFLRVCDVVLRLPGVSPGADQEEVWARELGIPVVRSIEALLNTRVALKEE